MALSRPFKEDRLERPLSTPRANRAGQRTRPLGFFKRRQLTTTNLADKRTLPFVFVRW